MEKWVRSPLHETVQFLCVCVDAQEVALQFQRMFGFTQVRNCWIPSKHYFPVGYGQLGCSGFVVVDPQGCFISSKTRAYLQHGEEAFDHVLGLLKPFVLNRATDVLSNDKIIGTISEPMDTYSLPSVGVKSMDKEHESCLTALKVLVEEPTASNLQAVLNELYDHFSHEEMLLKQHGFGEKSASSSSGFSPLESHIADHVRILAIVRDELARVNPKSAANAACRDSSS